MGLRQLLLTYVNLMNLGQKEIVVITVFVL